MPGQPRKMTRQGLACHAAVLLIVLGVNAVGVSAVAQVTIAKKTVIFPLLPPPGDIVVSTVGGSAVVIVDAGGITASPAVAGVTAMRFAVAGPDGQLLFVERSGRKVPAKGGAVTALGKEELTVGAGDGKAHGRHPAHGGARRHAARIDDHHRARGGHGRVDDEARQQHRGKT